MLIIPDKLGPLDSISLYEDSSTNKCRNDVEYSSMEQFGECNKLLNVFYIPLNLTYLKGSCDKPNAYTNFLIKDFRPENGKIDILDYKRYSNNACKLLNMSDVTEHYSSYPEIEKSWFIKIANSPNSIHVFGNNDLDITYDNFIC